MSRATRRRRALQATLLVLLSLALYWPLGTWFQSDDFIAVTYAHDLSHVIHDFLGAQYGLQGHALFWRPLITASFWVESHLFGGNPFGYHLDNTLVHGLNTLLLLLVLARLLGWKWAFRAALLWALHPALSGSVVWTVGRVDVHSTFWILLGLAFHLRWEEGRGSRLPAMAAFALGLATKELALAFPLLVGALALVKGGALGRRWNLHEAARQTAPYLALLFPYFLLRWILFGSLIGGYSGPSGLPSLPHDFSIWLGRLLLPLGSPLGNRVLGAGALWTAWAAGGFWLFLTFQQLKRYPESGKPEKMLLGIAWFLAASVPLYTFFQFLGDLKIFRLFYLPLAGLMAAGAAGGWRPTLLLLLLMLPVHFPVRSDMAAAMAFNRKAHLGILAMAREMKGPDPIWVEGLPAARGMGLEMALGPDRLLLPPFGPPGAPRLLPWRPMARGPGHLAWTPEETAFPLDRILSVSPSGEVGRKALPSRPLARFRLVPGWPERLDYQALLPLGYPPGSGKARDYTLATDPPAPGRYRILLFMGQGYTACEISSDREGRLSLREILKAPSTRSGDGDFVAFQVAVGLDVDLDPRPILFAEGIDPSSGRPLALPENLPVVPFDRSALSFFLGRKR